MKMEKLPIPDFYPQFSTCNHMLRYLFDPMKKIIWCSELPITGTREYIYFFLQWFLLVLLCFVYTLSLAHLEILFLHRNISLNHTSICVPHPHPSLTQAMACPLRQQSASSLAWFFWVFFLLFVLFLFF